MFFVRLRALVKPAMGNVCSAGILPTLVNFKVPLVECNTRKHQYGAEDYLRQLLEEGRMTRREFQTRLKALRGLQLGRVRPVARKNQHG